MSAWEAAQHYILQYFPDCFLAVLGGSASREVVGEHVDLDLVICGGDADGAYRRTDHAYGWMVEVFYFTATDYRDMFDAGIRTANPALQRMLTEGRLLRAEGELAQFIIEEAKQDLLDGPMPWSSFEVDHIRYLMTEQVEDIEEPTTIAEGWFAAGKLACLICEFRLRTTCQWMGEGKHLFRYLRQYDASLASKLEEALGTYFCRQDPQPLRHCAERALIPYGGFLSAGYKA
jgi:hypothetical protein